MKTAQRKAYKNVTAQDFKLIQELKRLGIKNTRIQEITGRSTNTVANAVKSETFNEYKERVATQAAKYNKPAATPVVSENIFSNRGEEKELTVVDVLVELNANVCRLVEAWERSPKQ